MNNNHIDKELHSLLANIQKTLQQHTVIGLYNLGISQPDIARNLGIGAGTVNKLLKGAKKSRISYGQETEPKNTK